MAKHDNTEASDLATPLEELRLANFHLSNLVNLAAANAQDESETILAAARHYVNEEFSIYQRLVALTTPAPIPSASPNSPTGFPRVLSTTTGA